MKTRKFIKINKLFGKYDNEIDLSSRGIIFIGENGVGKTTIMKIIQNLMNYNFSELIKYDFESIDIEVSLQDGKMLHKTIMYADLLPTDEEIRNLIKNSKLFEEDYIDEWHTYSSNLDKEDKIEAVNSDYPNDDWNDDDEKADFWDDTYDQEEYYNGNFYVLSEELINDIIKKNELNNIIRKIIKNEEFTNLYYKTYIDSLKKEKDSYYINDYIGFYSKIDERLKDIVSMIKEYIEKILSSNKSVHFENRKDIIKILKIIKGSKNKYVYILDMTKIYTFDNKLLSSSLITNKLLEWKAAIPNKTYKLKLFKETVDTFPGRVYDFFENMEKSIYEEVLQKIDGRRYKDIDKDNFINCSKDISELNSNTIEINSIINHYYYNEDFIAQINSAALAYYVVANNKEWQLNNKKEATADMTLIKDRYIKYIRPVLLKNGPFDIEWGAENSIGSIDENRVFCDFYAKEWNSFEENVNPKMKTLQELLNKYMMNKDVEVTPMGLLVKCKDDNHVIPLNSLSSGEKKLLIIFLHCLFNEDVPILIDEPEISLSIIWQENLLPDLLEKTNIKQVIVATHSSAVISDSSLDKYIIPLPNSIVDKGGNSNE